MRVFGVVLLGLLGCGYHGGFHVSGIGSHPPTRTQIGCLDLGVGMHHLTSASAPVVRYGFGNRCDRRIRLQLATLRAVGRTADGRTLQLAAQDAGWLGPRDLGARWFARELIRYAPEGGPSVPLHEVCIDVGALHVPVVGDPALAPTDPWLCFATGAAS